MSSVQGPNGTVPHPANGANAPNAANGANGPNAASAVAAGKSHPPAQPAAVLEEQRRVEVSQRVAAAFGSIVSVMMQSPGFQHYTMADLKWLVVPALTTGQFSLAQARMKGTGDIRPVGALLWASVSDAVDQRLTAEVDSAIRLQPSEWRSGSILWVVEGIGERAIVAGLIRRLREKEWRGQPIKIKVRAQDGSPIVRQLPAAGLAPAGAQAGAAAAI